MHFLVDLRWMIPEYTGGIEVHARAFLNTILKIDTTNFYTVLLPSTTRYDFDLRRSSNVHFQVCDGPEYYLSKVMLLVRMAWLRKRNRRLGGTWIQASQTIAGLAISPSGIIQPDLYPLKNLIIIADIQHEFYPRFFTELELKRRREDFSASIGHADHICAISYFTKQTLIDRLGVPAERISVAYLGSDPISSGLGNNFHKTLKKYDLEANGFLYYPANTWHHKNHRLILESLHILRERAQLQPILVCTGTPKEAHKELLELSAHLGLQEQFRFLGYCPREEIISLYKGATAMVFPSLFEGFGMPVVEAMKYDCPVICSNTTSLPEIAGDAALFINPEQPESLAEAIQQILANTSLQESLISRGRKQADKFSWVKFTLNILQAAIRLGSNSVSNGK